MPAERTGQPRHNNAIGATCCVTQSNRPKARSAAADALRRTHIPLPICRRPRRPSHRPATKVQLSLASLTASHKDATTLNRLNNAGGPSPYLLRPDSAIPCKQSPCRPRSTGAPNARQQTRHSPRGPQPDCLPRDPRPTVTPASRPDTATGHPRIPATAGPASRPAAECTDSEMTVPPRMFPPGAPTAEIIIIILPTLWDQRVHQPPARWLSSPGHVEKHILLHASGGVFDDATLTSPRRPAERASA